MNYYEHHLGDYAQATAHLSFVEDAAYSRLIRKYYADERPLPADVAQAQRLVGARSRDERAAVEAVLREFFVLEADGWHNARCDREIARFHAKSDRARSSANARWSQSDGTANAMRTHSERNANASPTHGVRNALQTPDSSHQTPEVREGERERETAAAVAAPAKPPKASRAKPRAPIPDGDWLTDADRKFATDRVPDMDIAATFQNFRDHHLARGTLGADWHAGWRTWVGNCQKGFPYVRRTAVAAVQQPTYTPAQWRELQAQRRAAS